MRKKWSDVYIGDGWLGAHVEAHDTAVDFGAREEGAGGDFMKGARAGVELHAHREDRHCAGLGNHALGHFLLHEQDCQCGGRRTFQNVFEDSAGDVVGKVGDYFIGNG